LRPEGGQRIGPGAKLMGIAPRIHERRLHRMLAIEPESPFAAAPMVAALFAPLGARIAPGPLRPAVGLAAGMGRPVPLLPGPPVVALVPSAAHVAAFRLVFRGNFARIPCLSPGRCAGKGA